jgi:hypothetical protein
MRQTPVITSTSKGKATSITVKFAEPYVCVRTLKQTKGEKKGIKRKEKDYQSVYYSHYHVLSSIQSILSNTLLCSVYLLLIK